MREYPHTIREGSRPGPTGPDPQLLRLPGHETRIEGARVADRSDLSKDLRELKERVLERRAAPGIYDLGNLAADEQYPEEDKNGYRSYQSTSELLQLPSDGLLPKDRMLVAVKFGENGNVQIKPYLEKGKIIELFGKRSAWYVSMRIPKEGLGAPPYLSRDDLLLEQNQERMKLKIYDIFHLGPDGVSSVNPDEDFAFTVLADGSLECRLGISATRSGLRNAERVLRTELMCDTFNVTKMQGKSIFEHMERPTHTRRTNR